MKHIKNFNESNKEEYYQEVGMEEWDSFQPLDMSEKFYKRIDSLVDKSIYSTRLGYGAILIIGSLNMSPKNGKYSCCIFTSGDEWYWVCINSEKALYLDSYYKCDQDTGLIMLLKDKGII
jgi:uncharacterized UBP type Zn finger protein